MRTLRFLSFICCAGFAFNGLAATFTVTSANDSGPGSLRQAVFDANDTPGKDIIQFNILPAGPQTIVLIADGLAITDPVTIDGSTQPGFAGKPVIVLTGDEDANPGLSIATSNCSIWALVISNFAGNGVVIQANGHDNVIGGTNTSSGNVIVSNAAAGVAILSGTNNAIRGNSIFGNGALGIDLGGDGITPNDNKDPDTGPNQLQNYPILSSATISSNSIAISGTLNSRSNSIFQIDFFASPACDDSGNGEAQAYLGTRSVTNSSSGATNFNITLAVAVPGRYLTATATDPLGNTSEFSPCLRAGSTLPPLTFTVNNTNDGGPGSLRQAMMDANGWLASGSNSISFNIPATNVHTIAPTSPLPVLFNSAVIDGYTQPGSSQNVLSNGFNANLLIRLDGAQVGADAAGLMLHCENSVVRGLVVVNFQAGGIQLMGAMTNLILGNLIGLDVDGSALGNGITQAGDSVAPGVLLVNSAGNTIGGAAPAARNIISANGTDGIRVTGAASTGNQVLGNFIGTDSTGRVGLGNGRWGVDLDGASSTFVGGVAIGAGNLISWNGDGLLISTAAFSRVQGNLIGSDVTGTNDLGNGSGVRIIDSSSCLIGGTNAAARNIIVGNGRGGIEGLGVSVSNNVIQGNFIGTDLTGRLALGNGSFGLLFEAGQANLIGGTVAGAGNTIAYNMGNGVELLSGAQNAILRNAIFGNAGLGIDLGGDGVTANDTDDTDSGANGLQNFPEWISALIFTNRTVIRGTLGSLPGTTYLVQVFDNETCSDSGFGGGQTFLAGLNVTTDAGGHATFSYTNPSPLLPGHYISGTATDPGNNTSEFSSCIRLLLFDSVDLEVTLADAQDPAGLSSNLTYTITVANNGPAAATGVLLTDTLPASVSYVSAVSSQGVCSNSAGVVTCRLNTISNGAIATVTLMVHGTGGGLVENVVSVLADQTDHTPGNNTASEFTLLGIANLAVTLAGAPTTVSAGALLTYTLTITNLGPDPATDILVTDPLPPGITMVSVTSSAGNCTWDGATVNCLLAGLNSQASMSISIRVRPSVLGLFTHEATVATATSDPNLADNVASASVQIIPLTQPSLSLAFADGNLTLDWPAGTSPEFVLESATNLAPPATWNVLSNASKPLLLTNSPADRARFFRMRLP